MLDIKQIRQNTQEIEKKLHKRDATINLSGIVELDEKRRALLFETEELKNKRNVVSKEIGNLIKQDKDVSKEKDEIRKVSERIKELDDEIRNVEAELTKQMLQLPNIPHDSVPVSDNEDDKIIINKWGTKPEFSFTFKNHVELGKDLDIFDFDRATKISQPQFALYKGDGALLEWALIRYMIDFLTGQKGFTLIIPPYLVNEVTATTSGNLPKFADQLYYSEKDSLYLIPTAEVPLTSMHRDEILSESELPLYYCAYTACFRREAGTYGKEERGLIRVHQFNKVEMFKFCTPETSYNELDHIIKCAEELLMGLGMHFRTALLVTSDIGQQSAKTCDIEVWLPGQNRYYEVSSCSNCEDYQARRGNIRYKAENAKNTRFVHTLNGSGLATSRLLVSLLETNQQPDGSVRIPDVLQVYMGGRDVLIPKKNRKS